MADQNPMNAMQGDAYGHAMIGFISLLLQELENGEMTQSEIIDSLKDKGVPMHVAAMLFGFMANTGFAETKTIYFLSDKGRDALVQGRAKGVTKPTETPVKARGTGHGLGPDDLDVDFKMKTLTPEMKLVPRATAVTGIPANAKLPDGPVNVTREVGGPTIGTATFRRDGKGNIMGDVTLAPGETIDTFAKTPVKMSVGAHVDRDTLKAQAQSPKPPMTALNGIMVMERDKALKAKGFTYNPKGEVYELHVKGLASVRLPFSTVLEIPTFMAFESWLADFLKHNQVPETAEAIKAAIEAEGPAPVHVYPKCIVCAEPVVKRPVGVRACSDACAQKAVAADTEEKATHESRRQEKLAELSTKMPGYSVEESKIIRSNVEKLQKTETFKDAVGTLHDMEMKLVEQGAREAALESLKSGLATYNMELLIEKRPESGRINPETMEFEPGYGHLKREATYVHVIPGQDHSVVLCGLVVEEMKEAIYNPQDPNNVFQKEVTCDDCVEALKKIKVAAK